jgi:predicted transcriptional regulator
MPDDSSVTSPELSDADDESSTDQESDQEPIFISDSELFLRVNSLIPEPQVVVTIEPGRPCSEAIQLMAANGFSQIPIVKGRQAIGLFTYRSFARAAVQTRGVPPGDMPVDEAMEEPKWIRATDELEPLVDDFDEHDALLVGAENDLQGVVTGIDVVRRLMKLSEPFVLIRGIELALGALVNAAADPPRVAELARAVLTAEYEERGLDPPLQLRDMNLGEKVSIIRHPSSWIHFKSTLGANRRAALAHFERLSTLRNDLFHFRRQLNDDEVAHLRSTSHWLRSRMRAMGLTEGTG